MRTLTSLILCLLAFLELTFAGPKATSGNVAQKKRFVRALIGHTYTVTKIDKTGGKLTLHIQSGRGWSAPVVIGPRHPLFKEVTKHVNGFGYLTVTGMAAKPYGDSGLLGSWLDAQFGISPVPPGIIQLPSDPVSGRPPIGMPPPGH